MDTTENSGESTGYKLCDLQPEKINRVYSEKI